MTEVVGKLCVINMMNREEVGGEMASWGRQTEGGCTGGNWTVWAAWQITGDLLRVTAGPGRLTVQGVGV